MFLARSHRIVAGARCCVDLPTTRLPFSLLLPQTTISCAACSATRFFFLFPYPEEVAGSVFPLMLLPVDFAQEDTALAHKQVFRSLILP